MRGVNDQGWSLLPALYHCRSDESDRLPEYPELKDTLELESSIARILARASVEGLPLDVNVLNSMLNNYNMMLKEAFEAFIALIQPYYISPNLHARPGSARPAWMVGGRRTTQVSFGSKC